MSSWHKFSSTIIIIGHLWKPDVQKFILKILVDLFGFFSLISYWISIWRNPMAVIVTIIFTIGFKFCYSRYWLNIFWQNISQNPQTNYLPIMCYLIYWYLWFWVRWGMITSGFHWVTCQFKMIENVLISPEIIWWITAILQPLLGCCELSNSMNSIKASSLIGKGRAKWVKYQDACCQYVLSLWWHLLKANQLNRMQFKVL